MVFIFRPTTLTDLSFDYQQNRHKCCNSASRQLRSAKEGFTEASLGLLANQRRRQLLTGLLKSLRTIKTLVITSSTLLMTKQNDTFLLSSFTDSLSSFSFLLFHLQQRTDVRLSEMLEVSLKKFCPNMQCTNSPHI